MNEWGPGRAQRLKAHRDLTKQIVAKYASKESKKQITADDVQILWFKRTPAKTKKTMFNWHAMACVWAAFEGGTKEHPFMYELIYDSDRRSIWIGEYMPTRNDNLPFRK